MEHIAPISGTVRGIEVLHFPEAEVEKFKGHSISFASAGSLSVLYFKDYNRFVLQLNDWRYPLLRRLPINSVTGKDQDSFRHYILLGPNGFSYNLRITAPTSTQGLSNLDTIFEHHSRFSLKGQESLKKVEASPDDKIVRQSKKDTGIAEVISETFKQTIKKVENKVSTFKTGTKHLTSTKKMVNLKDIKKRNFKKEASSRIKKSFFQFGEKQSSEFMEKRKENINMTQLKLFEDLVKTGESQAPPLYLPKDSLEESILRSKEEISMHTIPMDQVEAKKGLMTELREKARDIPMGGQVQAEKMPISGGMTHDLA